MLHGDLSLPAFVIVSSTTGSLCLDNNFLFNIFLVQAPPGLNKPTFIIFRITPSHMFVIHTFATRWQAWTSLREQRVYFI